MEQDLIQTPEGEKIDPSVVQLMVFEKENPGFQYSTIGVSIPGNVVRSMVFEDNVRNKWFTVKAGDVVIDIGAGYGSYTLTALALGAGLVVAVEPGLEEHLNLCSNLMLNKFFGRYFTFPCLLVDDVNKKVNYHSDCHSCFYGGGKVSPRVTCTLNDIAVLFSLNKLDWLKVDVEGYELEVLKGGEAFLKYASPKIIIENHLGIVPDAKERTGEFLGCLGYTETDNIVGEGVNDNWSLWSKN